MTCITTTLQYWMTVERCHLSTRVDSFGDKRHATIGAQWCCLFPVSFIGADLLFVVRCIALTPAMNRWKASSTGTLHIRLYFIYPWIDNWPCKWAELFWTELFGFWSALVPPSLVLPSVKRWVLSVSTWLNFANNLTIVQRTWRRTRPHPWFSQVSLPAMHDAVVTHTYDDLLCCWLMIVCSILQSYIYLHHKNATHFVDVEKVRKYSERQRQVITVSESALNFTIYLSAYAVFT